MRPTGSSHVKIDSHDVENINNSENKFANKDGILQGRKVTKLKNTTFQTIGKIKKSQRKPKGSKKKKPITSRKIRSTYVKSAIPKKGKKDVQKAEDSFVTSTVSGASKVSLAPLIRPEKSDTVEQFTMWKNFLNTHTNEGKKKQIVEGLFGELYPRNDQNSFAVAKERIQKLVETPGSKLFLLMNSLYSQWQKGAQAQVNMKVLQEETVEILTKAWQRMSVGDTYKIQMLTESLYLQEKGGHPSSKELKKYMENMSEVTNLFRDGFVYDGTNALDDNLNNITQSQKKMVVVESAFKYEGEPEDNKDIKVARRPHKDNYPDISVSNFGDDKVKAMGGISDTNGKLLDDTVYFSNGIYAFHRPSIAMDKREQVMADQLLVQPGQKESAFTARLKTYINDHVNVQKMPLEKLTICGDFNLYLFNDNAETKERELKPGVQEVLDEMHLALVVPSGLVTRGRPVSDQLHKNLEIQPVEGQRDTMVMLYPVTNKNKEEAARLAKNPLLCQDTFFPATDMDGRNLELDKEVYGFNQVRKQFSIDSKDRIMTDHAMLTSPEVVLCNMADCFGVTTKVKSLEETPQKKLIWGDKEVSVEKYEQLMGDSAEILTKSLEGLVL